MRIGLDTGFFYALQEGHPEAERLWAEGDLCTSAVVLYELHKKCLKGEFASNPELLGDIRESVDVEPVTTDVALRASHLAHGLGIPGLDALILASLLEAGCREIYTLDEHFLAYKKKGVKIIHLTR